MRYALSLFAAFITAALLFVTASVIVAWTGPTAVPPNNNVPAPINVGTIDQIKSAGIGVNTLAVFGNAVISTVSGYLNFGTTVGSSGYGFRDNAGVMEFKDSGGTWKSFQAFVCGLVSCTGGDGGDGGDGSGGGGGGGGGEASCTGGKAHMEAWYGSACPAGCAPGYQCTCSFPNVFSGGYALMQCRNGTVAMVEGGMNGQGCGCYSSSAGGGSDWSGWTASN